MNDVMSSPNKFAEPEVIAHRGGGGEWPPETMYAFDKAIELGVDWLEMDVRRCKTGEIILMHNSDVQRTTGVSACVRNLTIKQVKELNAAARWGPNPIFKKIPIPELSDVIQLLKDCDKMRANIEIKPRDPSLAREVGKLLDVPEIRDRVLIASAWHSVLKAFRKDYPDIKTSASVWEIIKFQIFCNLLSLPYKLKKKTHAIQWHSRMRWIPVITERFVTKAKAQGLIVHAWTVNEPEEMARMIHLGVDGIITDYPTTLMKILNRPPKAKCRQNIHSAGTSLEQSDIS